MATTLDKETVDLAASRIRAYLNIHPDDKYGYYPFWKFVGTSYDKVKWNVPTCGRGWKLRDNVAKTIVALASDNYFTIIKAIEAKRNADKQPS